MLRKILAVMAVSAGAILIALLPLGDVAGQAAPSASRAFSSSSVAAGDEVIVTITVSDAIQAVVTETLRSGFRYVSSSLPDNQVRPDANGRDYSFILADGDDNPFMYTVAVSQTGSISGKLRVDRVDYDVRDPAPAEVEVTDEGGPSASRAFSSSSVAAGDEVVVTITVSDAIQAVVTETLPSGFRYVSSSLPDNQVRPDANGRDYSFILADGDDNPFTYTVAVSQTGSISGKLRVDRVDYDVDDDATRVTDKEARRRRPGAYAYAQAQSHRSAAHAHAYADGCAHGHADACAAHSAPRRPCRPHATATPVPPTATPTSAATDRDTNACAAHTRRRRLCRQPRTATSCAANRDRDACAANRDRDARAANRDRDVRAADSDRDVRAANRDRDVRAADSDRNVRAADSDRDDGARGRGRADARAHGNGDAGSRAAGRGRRGAGMADPADNRRRGSRSGHSRHSRPVKGEIAASLRG